jgi:hypothetical protein
MPNVADGSVLGDDCKLYYSATLGGAGALTEIPVVIDDAINSERRSVESNCRGDAEISEHTGKPKYTLSVNMLFKRGSPGTTYAAMRAAYTAGTVHHYALASGTVTDVGQVVFRLEGRIKSWNETQPDNDTKKVSIEIAKAADNSYASNYSTVSS